MLDHKKSEKDCFCFVCFLSGKNKRLFNIKLFFLLRFPRKNRLKGLGRIEYTPPSVYILFNKRHRLGVMKQGQGGMFKAYNLMYYVQAWFIHIFCSFCTYLLACMYMDPVLPPPIGCPNRWGPLPSPFSNGLTSFC